ncbi:hypothetical protein O181_064477 [Austropuccinia psidii MF-1]|uniref:Reverse transcriptase/retrotransposon-derived protein RNase H-like domain-containing protein n=1 Tax=Austropuccinia psidii MF-1 TaxID=1389203 RepID=A0A9Q3EVU6_9BASI|nr:hypothetical protein [Austropuccinia psidii MF-1]
MSELPEKIPIIILSSPEYPSLFVTHHTKYMERADHQEYYDPSEYLSNDFSSAKSCAALVGDSRTPSFPYSIHLPSLNCHRSSLSSEYEVFKNIQDVREDDFVSSLHCFLGNMDLPPSSYNCSLDELWDEEEEPEEIEKLMKLVNSVYHHYLNVVSKVKEEKLPPHCSSDYHNKLEGSLPPFHQFKEAFTTAPALSYFNPSLPAIVETNASDYALGAVLIQENIPLNLIDARLFNQSSNMRLMTRNSLEYSGLSRTGELFLSLFLPLLKFSQIIPHSNTSCLPRFPLSVKPAVLNSSLNSISQ